MAQEKYYGHANFQNLPMFGYSQTQQNDGGPHGFAYTNGPPRGCGHFIGQSWQFNSSNRPPKEPRQRFDFNGPMQRFNGPSRENDRRFNFPNGPPRGYNSPPHRFGGMPPPRFNGPVIGLNEPCPPYPHSHEPQRVGNGQIGPNGLPLRFNGPNIPIIGFSGHCPPYPHSCAPLHVGNGQIGPNGPPQTHQNQWMPQQELNGPNISQQTGIGKKKKRRKKKKAKGATSVDVIAINEPSAVESVALPQEVPRQRDPISDDSPIGENITVDA